MKPMTTPELVQWLRDNSSGVYRPANDAADLIVQLIDRNTALVAALRDAREYIDSLMNVTAEEAGDFLTNNGSGVLEDLNDALHIDAFDVGDTVIAESADLELSEYEGCIVSKRVAPNGVALFTVEDMDGDCNDHEAYEMRLVGCIVN